MKINRFKIEMFCTFMSLAILVMMAAGVIFYTADQMFKWHIFVGDIENFASFMFICLGSILIATAVVSIMINISIIAVRISSLDEKAGRVLALKDRENNE